MNNIVSILSFDSRCIQALLHEKHEALFDNKYPIFYKMKKNGGEVDLFASHGSAIDIALEHNQIVGLNLMVRYITTHQNHFASSFLFESNLLELLKRGIQVKQLLQSNIFNH